MREAKAEFPPITFAVTDSAGFEESDGWSATFTNAALSRYSAIHEIEIDLSGLQVQERVLAFNNIQLGRMPSFNTTGAPTATNNWDSIIDVHLITTTPLCYDGDVDRAGEAPTQNRIYQMNQLVQNIGTANFTSNNGYPLPTIGLLPASSRGDLFIFPHLNFDVKQLVYCRIDTMATSLQTLPIAQSPFNIVDSTTYGMAGAAALDKMYCYRIIMGKGTIDSTVSATIGPSIIQMITSTPKLESIERLNIMDLNFNNTNPLV
jgi:hypothetical protein